MANAANEKSYLDINELVARTGLSEATIWRLKRAGRIPFFQPGGKGSRVKFPENAIEHALSPAPIKSAEDAGDSPEQLPGPRPKWML